MGSVEGRPLYLTWNFRRKFRSKSVCAFSAQTLGVKRGRYRLDVHAPNGEKTTMKNYTIIRIEKLNSTVSIRRSIKHAFRAQDTPNADPARLSENSHFFADDVPTAMQKIKQRWPEKIRKNGVRLVEFLVSASPEAINAKTREEQDAYFADALKYIQDKHGAENVAYAGIHRDESTPHMYVYAVPLDSSGKLNCNGFYGKRTSLSDLQTDFSKRVGEPHGLMRGERKSKARHTTIKQYYTRVNAVESMELDSDNIEYPAPSILDRAKTAEYGQKVANTIAEQYDERLKNHTVKASAVNARLTDRLRESTAKATKLQQSNENYQAEISRLNQRVGALSESLKTRKNALLAVIEERDGFQKIAGLFTTDEINVAKERRARNQELIAQKKEREAAAAKQLREENERRWAEEQRAKDEAMAKVKAEAAALMRYENAAREEYRLLRAECFERHEEKMGEFFNQYDLTDLTWTERVALLKSEAEKWQKSAEADQKAQQTEENLTPAMEQEQENEENRGYDSPSPF